MRSLTLILVNKTYQLHYDIIYDRLNSAKILVFPETGFDEVNISYNDKYLRIMTIDYDSNFNGYAYICLKHKIKKVEYSVKNGIIVLNIKYKRFLLF